MVFNSLEFLIFFPTVLGLLALVQREGIARLLPLSSRELGQWLLLLASYFFYAWWDWRFCLLMLALSLTAWLCALDYHCRGKKYSVVLGVVAPLVVLGIFKYYNFFMDSLTYALGLGHWESLNIILPVGISFYTFQCLSYTIDVYRGKLEPERSFMKVALYISFFPQLVAGPIVKAGYFLPQLREDRRVSLEGIEAGVQIFALGLFKKIVIADNIAGFVDAVYLNPIEFHALTVILAVLGYSLQIYCDFSGYSDMAVGCARCLGYDLDRNFNLPYLAKNVTEFWKRWHISLSTWLMEYLYFPLGGSRRGEPRRYLNLMLTMLIGGLWHGAAWTFVVWGGLHGAALCVHKLYMRLRRGKEDGKLYQALSVAGTFVFVSLCWVFFRAESFSNALAVLRAMFTWQQGLIWPSSWVLLGTALVALASLMAILRCRELKAEKVEGFYPRLRLNTVGGLTLFFLFLGFCLGLGYTGENPFIYFQF